MVTINRLSQAATPADADQIPIWQDANADTRKVTLEAVKDYVLPFVTPARTAYTRVTASPAASGFVIALGETSDHVWLLVFPAAGYASGTITLPSAAGCADGQEIRVNCSRAITALSIDANGAATSGAPASLGADDWFALRFDLATLTWFRVA